MNIQESVLIYLDDIAKENLLKRQIEAHVHIPKGTLSVSDSYFPPKCQKNSDVYREPRQELSLSFGKGKAALFKELWLKVGLVSFKPPQTAREGCGS